jgi:16S rRNA (adenine1518-N6/adenine1519-N6)-dimethyltransferase
MMHQDLRNLLARYGITPVHARGQNFLVNEGVLEAIVAAAEVRPGDQVLEIGPGPGVLTERLLAAGAYVVAVEIDARLQGLLRDRFAGAAFTLVSGDALEQRAADLVRAFPRPGDAYKVVANIPYGITSKLLLKFLLEQPTPTVTTVMVQREVADRIVAEGGKMSRLAVLVQALGQPRKVMNVSRGSFTPPPRVDSAVLQVVHGRHPGLAALGDEELEAFFDMVGRLFSGKRKKLRNLLAGMGVKEFSAIEAAGINPQLRPEDLRLDDWVRLRSALLN